jgi:hypothetical protein
LDFVMVSRSLFGFAVTIYACLHSVKYPVSKRLEGENQTGIMRVPGST